MGCRNVLEVCKNKWEVENLLEKPGNENTKLTRKLGDYLQRLLSGGERMSYLVKSPGVGIRVTFEYTLLFHLAEIGLQNQGKG